MLKDDKKIPIFIIDTFAPIPFSHLRRFTIKTTRAEPSSGMRKKQRIDIDAIENQILSAYGELLSFKSFSTTPTKEYENFAYFFPYFALKRISVKNFILAYIKLMCQDLPHRFARMFLSKKRNQATKKKRRKKTLCKNCYFFGNFHHSRKKNTVYIPVLYYEIINDIANMSLYIYTVAHLLSLKANKIFHFLPPHSSSQPCFVLDKLGELLFISASFCINDEASDDDVANL